MEQINEASHIPSTQASADGSSAGASEFLFIGELAAMTGTDPKTIRFYERAGLLSPPRHGRFRTYLDRDVQRLKDILAMRRMGVPIAKIRLILNAHDQDMPVNHSSTTVSLLQSHMENLKAKQREVIRQIEVTDEILAQCNKGERLFAHSE